MQSETADSPGSATGWTRRNIRVVFDSGPFAQLCVNMMSSTKPEVHNISHCRQTRTEQCNMNFNMYREKIVKLWRVVFQTCEHTDNTETHRHADHNTADPYRGEVTMVTPGRAMGRWVCVCLSVRIMSGTITSELSDLWPLIIWRAGSSWSSM